MADRPIIFSGPMVRALLDRRKTQTRRVLKPQPSGIRSAEATGARTWNLEPESNRCTVDWTPPRYAPGDRLWVREACHIDKPQVSYRADADPASDPPGPWRSPFHMPRWASRLTLIVTDVRVQRLQEISEADAEKEGVQRLKSGRGFYDPTLPKAAVRFGEWTSTARQGFCRLWNSLHGPDAWDANPWVAALTFTVHRCNIDQVGIEQ